MQLKRSPLRLQNPTLARTFGRLLAVSILASSSVGLAQEVLNEATVIRWALAQSPNSLIANATEDLAEARSRTAGRMPNPTVAWNREAVGTGPASTQDIVSASLPISIARPLTTHALAGAQGAWMRSQAALSRDQAVLAAVLAYYDLASSAEQIRLLTRAVSNLEEAARVLARREAAGSASGYETTRLAIAAELRRSQLSQAEGNQERLRSELSALLGRPSDEQPSPQGLTLIGMEDAPQAEAEPRQTLLQARSAERLSALAQGRAAWAWLPVLRVDAGIKHINAIDASVGYVVGLSLSLPVFDHGQALEAEAEAARALSLARVRALAQRIEADKRGARIAYQSARQELKRFEARTGGQIESLLAAAQSGYREGERSILELLDAQRAQTEVAERRLHLLLTAKRAEARLRSAAGVLL